MATKTCTRCNGRGGWEGWPGFTCFKCGGTGKIEITKKETAKRVSKWVPTFGSLCCKCHKPVNKSMSFNSITKEVWHAVEEDCKGQEL